MYTVHAPDHLPLNKSEFPTCINALSDWSYVYSVVSSHASCNLASIHNILTAKVATNCDAP